MRAFQRSRSGGRFLTILLLLLTIIAAAPGSALALDSHPPRLPEPSNVTGASGGGGLHGNVYTGFDFPFSVTFDPSIWTVSPYVRVAGYEGFSITSDATLGAIEVSTDRAAVTDCLATVISGLSRQEGFFNVHAAPDLDAPATAAGVEATMFTFDISFGEGDTPYTGYIECRALDGGKSVLHTQLAAPNQQLDEAFPTWAPLLSGIEIGTAADGSTTDAADAEATATVTPGADDGIENVVGSTYTSPRFGFSISWPDAYVPVMAWYDSDMDGDVLMAAHGGTDFYVSSAAIADYPVADCFSFNESMIHDKANTNVELMNAKGGQPMRQVSDTLSYALYRYTMNGKNGPRDVVEYIQCQADPTGTFMLEFSFMTPAESFTKTEEDRVFILNSIQFP